MKTLIIIFLFILYTGIIGTQTKKVEARKIFEIEMMINDTKNSMSQSDTILKSSIKILDKMTKNTDVFYQNRIYEMENWNPMFP